LDAEGKKTIFAKIAYFDDFPFSGDRKQETDFPQYQKEGRILMPRGCTSPSVNHPSCPASVN
jgi:hypothetical protein